MTEQLAQLSTDNWVSLIGFALTIIGGFAAVMRFVFRAALAPIASKVTEHDEQIASLTTTANRAVELGNSTNIKVSRVEGFLAGANAKLPEVIPTLEKPDDNGQITEEPLIPKED